MYSIATKNVKGWACFGIRYAGSVSEGPEILFGGPIQYSYIGINNGMEWSLNLS